MGEREFGEYYNASDFGEVTMKAKLVTLLACVCVAWMSGAAMAADWPQWRGPNRDAICRETGLLKTWPAGGPKLLWQIRGIGQGYSGPALVGNTLYTMGDKNGKATVFALDIAKDGKQIWATPIGTVKYKGYSPGTRATPTVDGDRVYGLSADGELACLDRKTGKSIWSIDYVKDFGGIMPRWAFAESVLIDGKKLICTPGGPKGTIVALDKMTGKVIWASKFEDKASYSSVVKTELAGVKQYVAFTNANVVGVAVEDGKLLWRYKEPAHRADWGDVNVMTPVVSGDTVFASSNYKTGGGLAKITKTATGLEAKQVWFTKEMANHHGGLILHDGALYGSHDKKGTFTCLDHKTGKVLWTSEAAGKCSVLYADGMLYCRDEAGPITLVKATPTGYVQAGRFDQPRRSKAKAWPHPVIANGKLYIRDQDILLCYDVRAGDGENK